MLILFEEEAEKIFNLFHISLCHLGIHMLQYEIERRNLYINNITSIIQKITKECDICLLHKLNKFIKPANQQIISNKPLERIQLDLTYFSNKIELHELKDKYLLNITDHFSKYSKAYLLENKTSKLVLTKLKDFIDNLGIPEIIHTDNGGEFTSNEFKLFCFNNSIKLINGGPYHPQSQGAIERFNRNIIDKLRYYKLL